MTWSFSAKQSLEQQYHLLNSLSVCPECDITIEKKQNIISIHGETDSMQAIENLKNKLKDFSFIKKIDSQINGAENKNKITIFDFSLHLTLENDHD
jgi:hypothetical protein